MIVPSEYLGPLVQICHENRGEQIDISNISDDRIRIQYLMPLSEIIGDFYSQVKEASSGYAR